jgi:hypothetical protein
MLLICLVRRRARPFATSAWTILCFIGWFSAAQSAEKSWRPFSDDSPWNQPVPASAPSDPNSAAMIGDFASRGALHVNLRDWSVPVYFVDADKTPKHAVIDSRPGIFGAGFEFPRQIPIPDDAVASPPVQDDSDNHLCIVDRRKNLEWGMWLARRNAQGEWTTGLGAVTDLSGTGVAPPWFAARREFDAHRARASGFPLIAGLMLADEFASGRIRHALVFAYDHCRAGFFVPPASTAQVKVPGTSSFSGIPMGGRIQLDPAWDVEHSGLSPAGKIIARALQEYGAYCGDYAGANVLYAENSPAALARWQGVLRSDELSAVFTPEVIRKNFRVVDMGSVLPGQNCEVRPPYLVAFKLPVVGATARIDSVARTIEITVPAGTKLDGLAPEFSLFPRSARLVTKGENQITGISRQNFSAPLKYELFVGATVVEWSVRVRAH